MIVRWLCPEPVVTFRLKDGQAFDEFQLSDRIRQHGWIVPAYTLPPNAEHITALRVVVRNDMSRDKVDILVRQLLNQCDELDKLAPPATPSDRKTGEHQRRRC